jgi:3,4-dihydroxy 2-butanone 4-phosphate synthase / GTP cyclohydrolase II
VNDAQPFSSIAVAVEALAAGRPVVVVDDAARENEGDLILAAQFATAERIGFMIRYTSGILCAPMLEQRLAELELSQMVTGNSDPLRTAFTVSVDARADLTTGVSAEERARTFNRLAASKSRAEDFVRPGHVFPLRYRDGGVLARPGHTEATIDLLRLACLTPVGVLAELVNDDGSMMRDHDLRDFADEHGLPFVTVAELISVVEEQVGVG